MESVYCLPQILPVTQPTLCAQHKPRKSTCDIFNTFALAVQVSTNFNALWLNVLAIIFQLY